jgi:hypothetical protein
MNKTVKWILIICLSMFVLCGCGAVATFTLLRATGRVMANTIQTDGDLVPAMSSEIAEYDVPDGFGPPFAVQVVGFSMISHTGLDNHSHIYFFRVPPNVHFDHDKVESKLRTSGWVQYPVRYRLVDEQPGMIRGEETTMVTSEGVNGSGLRYRQMSAAFSTGDGANAYVIISMPADSWDQALVDAFLGSIK